MNLYLENISSKLSCENQNLILYGAGSDALFILSELDRYGLNKPVCICDSDPQKWHRTLLGIEILPIDEALSTYSNAYIFVSTSLFRHQIIGQLISAGRIKKDRILNYEPYEKRKSCVYLESQLVVTNHKLQFCCSDFGKNTSPAVEFDGDYNTSVSRYLRLRDELINNLNNGSPTQCDGCPSLSYNFFADEKKIRMLVYGEDGICNFNCSYCSASARTSGTISTDIELQKLKGNLMSRKLLSEDIHTNISCGEISVHPKREEIYDAIEGSYNIICSNAAVFDDRIAAQLRNGKSVLNVSVDAGTGETFRKVKGRDFYDRIQGNLKRYASEGDNHLIELKYIFLQGMNDNIADIDGFASLCELIGAGSVQISYDLHAPNDLTDQTGEMVLRLIRLLTEKDLQYKIVSDTVSKFVNERVTEI
jgi:wyosine [tRNA(Phe)-imidazoG37] synthetase (radical SAM superfamily)